MALSKEQKTGLGILGTLAAIFGIRQLTKAAPPGEFQVTDLLISPVEVYVGEPVEISVLVTNIGAERATKTVRLEVS